MSTNVVSDRATAMRLVGEGNLSGAIRVLGAVVEASDEPEERLVLGSIAYIATDYGLAQAQLERAYRDFQAPGLPRRPPATVRRSTSTPGCPPTLPASASCGQTPLSQRWPAQGIG